MNRISSLFGIQYPIIQGGMVWCSGWKLASAVSNAGGLGLIGSGSMYPDVLREHIRKCRAATDKPFGVNIPLMYPQIEEIMNIVVEEGVKIVFTSAGNPKTWTGWLKERGITVAHVVSSSKFAMKCEEAGVDAIVAEGFEAGGHNGREETTTLCLIPAVREATTLPLIAAGGIGTGEAIFALMALGAEGVQMGTRFALTDESSASDIFKEYCLRLNEGDTISIGNVTLQVLHCPGHTPGHVVFFDDRAKLLISGDVIFKGGVGRSDFPRGDHNQLISSIKDKLLPLGDDVTFIPGHGPLSTLGYERLHNPFLQDEMPVW